VLILPPKIIAEKICQTKIIIFHFTVFFILTQSSWNYGSISQTSTLKKQNKTTKHTQNGKHHTYLAKENT